MSDRALLDMTADIVSAFVRKHSVRPAELPDLIVAVHGSLARIAEPAPAAEPEPELKPAVPIRKSVTDDFVISLEDGRKFKSMKRYLAGLGMTPDDYRAKWGLPRDYPMVAPGYAARRSELAKATGLGSGRKALPHAADLMEHTALSPVVPERATLAAVVAEAEPDAVAATLPSETVPSDLPVRRRGRPRKAA